MVQEAFERAMREPHFFEEVREPLAWLRTAVARRSLSRLRRRRVFERLRLTMPRSELEPWERADLVTALRRLPPRDRVVVVLRYFHDASYDEIAAAIGSASSSVGPMLSRARAQLREALA